MMQRDTTSKFTGTLSSGPMMRELQRWTSPGRVKRVKIAPHRWAEWARAMIGRHNQVIAPGRAQAMTFVKPATLVQLHERLTNFSLNVYSKMNLAIQPVLREIRLGEERASRARGAQPDGSRAYMRSDANPTLLRSRGFVDATGALSPVTFAGRRAAAEHSTSAIAHLASSPEGSTAGDDSRAKIGSSPGVSLVFRRMHQLDELVSSHWSETIHGNAGRDALRLARQLQRVEQAISGGTAEVARRLPASAATQQAAPQAIETEHAAQQTLGMFRSQEQLWRANAPQMPDAIVEQLTERVIRQIDQRTIAWRERTGKF